MTKQLYTVQVAYQVVVMADDESDASKVAERYAVDSLRDSLPDAIGAPERTTSADDIEEEWRGSIPWGSATGATVEKELRR